MIRPPIGRVFAYWRVERRTIRQGLVALLVATAANLVSGVVLGSITGTLRALPGLMVLLPAAIAMRGNVFGALGSRLGTSIHSGIFDVSMRREGVLYQNVFAAAVLTVSISFGLGVLAKPIAEAFGVESISVVDFVVISVLAGLLASLIVGTFTAVMSIQGYRRGWDLDSVTAPLVTAMGDLVTIPSLFLATFAVGFGWVTPLVAALAGVAAVYLTIRGVVTDLATTRRVVRESLPLLAVAGTVDLIAGIAVESRLEHFVTYPVLLVLIPPLLAGAGAMGGILSSRLASKLHLGALDPNLRPQAVAVLDTTIILLFALCIFTLLGISADAVGGIFGFGSPGALEVVGISLFAGLLATVLAVVVAYYTAIASYRMGFDPDTHGIPAITATMDLVGVICLVLALVVFGIA